MVAQNTARILLFTFISYMVASAVKGSDYFPLAQAVLETNPSDTIIAPLALDLGSVLLTEGSTDERPPYELLSILRRDSIETIKESLKSFGNPSTSENDKVESKWATRIFANHSIRPDSDYLQEISSYHNTKFTNINFTNATKAACCVNERMAEASNIKIKRIVDKENLAGSNAIIASVFSFKGQLQSDRSKKLQYRFTLSNGAEVNINYIAICGKYKYSNNNYLRAQMVSIPFVDPNYTMLLVFPNNIHTNFRAFFQNVNEANLMSFRSSESVNIQLLLPLIKFDVNSNMKEFLTSLRGNIVDVNQLGSKSPVNITNVYQRVVLDVNNRETKESCDSGQYPLLSLNVPFAFFIQYHRTTLLFGQVVRPNEN